MASPLSLTCAAQPTRNRVIRETSWLSIQVQRTSQTLRASHHRRQKKMRDVSTVIVEYPNCALDCSCRMNAADQFPHQAQGIGWDSLVLIGSIWILLLLIAPQDVTPGRRNLQLGLMFAVAASPYIWDAMVRFHLEKTRSSGKVFGAAMLVAGGTVGAGIVALPVKAAHIGFIPSAVCLFGGWGFMLLSAMLIVAMGQHCKKGANFTSMAEDILGRKWKATVAALYIFVYGETLTAYIAESATFLTPIASHLSGKIPSRALLALLFTIVCGSIVGLGSKVVDTANSACMFVAMGAIAMVLCLGASTISRASPAMMNWSGAAQTVPIMIEAFTFHNMIPLLDHYLGSAVLVQKVLLIGTAIPLAMYLIWEAMILGSLPPGASVSSVANIMRSVGANQHLISALNLFSLFAIVTSFLGVAMGCLDFSSDLMGQREQSAWQPLLITLEVPTTVACLCPEMFVAALKFSGIFILILFAVISALMIRKGPLAKSRWKGNLVVLLFCIAFITIIRIDIRGQFFRLA